MGRKNARLQSSRYDRNLPSGIPRAVRKKAVVVAARTRPVDGDTAHTGRRGLFRDERSEVDVPRTDCRLPGQLLADVSAHFVAAAADCRAQVDGELARCDSVSLEGVYGLRRDSGDRSAPAGVEKANDSRRVREKDGHAVGDSNSQRSSALARNVTVRFSRAQPPIPPAGMEENPVTVHLPHRHEPGSDLSQIVLHGAPAAHHLIDGLRAHEAEGSGVAGSGESADPPRIEFGDRLFFYLTHRYERRSSTREMDAPSAVNLSSMRS